MRAGLTAIALMLFTVTAYAADEAAFQGHDALVKELKTKEAELKLTSAAISCAREAAAAKNPPTVAEARKAVAEAEQALAAVQAEPATAALLAATQKTREARDAKVEELLKDAPTWQAARKKREELQASIKEIEGKLATADEAQLLKLAKLRGEESQLGRKMYGAARAMWKHGTVLALYQNADNAYKAQGAANEKNAALAAASGKLKAARKALDEAIDALPLEAGPGAALMARQEKLTKDVAAAKERVGELEKQLLGNAKTYSATIKVMSRKTKQEEDKKVTLWVPQTEYVRGVIVAHSMIKGLADGNTMRLVAAREGLATMVFDDFVGNGKESLARLDGLFEQFAAQSKHPELRGAPVLLGGLSASVLGTRNVACAVPERVFGVVHVAGGNMQEMPANGAGMVGVPFIAHNGEFEWCGPIGGIQPAYGHQTQWVMIREQMLRLWRNKFEHRMMLIVVPNADHGAWDQGLTAMFIRKAVQYRLPKEKRDGSSPATCVPIAASAGWLTDADLDHPKHEPAPYEKYSGDKNNAFWHFDEEMARAVFEYHRGQFLLPDLTKATPIPAEWPATKKTF